MRCNWILLVLVAFVELAVAPILGQEARLVRSSAQEKDLPMPEDDAKSKAVLTIDNGSHMATIYEVLFTPDGQRIISVSDDRTIQVWDRVTKERLRVIRPPVTGYNGGRLRMARLTPDGKTLAVGGTGYQRDPLDPKSWGNYAFLLDLEEGGITLLGMNSLCAALAFSADGSKLAAAHGATLHIYQRPEKGWNQPPEAGLKPTRALVHPAKKVFAHLAWNPDGKHLAASTHTDPGVHIWDLQKKAKPLEIPEGKDVALAWSPDGQRLAIGGWAGGIGGHLRLYSAEGKKLQVFPGTDLGVSFYKGGDMQVGQILFRTNDEAVLLGRAAQANKQNVGFAVLFDLKNGAGQMLARGPTDPRISPPGALSTDGKWVAMAALANSGNRIALREIGADEPLQYFGANQWPPYSVAWSRDGSSVAFQSVPGSPATLTKKETWSDLNLRELQLRTGKIFSSKEYQRQIHKRQDWQVECDNTQTLGDRRRYLAIKHGDQTVKTHLQYDHIRSYTLAPKGDVDWVAWGTTSWTSPTQGLYLSSTATGKLIHRFHPLNMTVHDVVASPDGKHLVASTDRQLLYVYRVDEPHPLLTVFVSGSDWIVWTKQGYYAATPGGERLMGWTVNNGMDKEASYHPAARFRASLYRPDVIQRVLAEGSVAKALAAADKARDQASKAVEIAQVLPPEVKLTVTPAGPANKVTVVAEATPQGTQPITSLQLLVDDRPYTGKDGLVTIAQTKAGPVQRTWQFDLPPGPHDIRVLARTDASLGSSRGIKRGDPQTAPAKKEANLYVLAVGINAYPGALKLNGAVSDAKNLGKAFTENSAKVFGNIEVKEIIDKEATKAGIRAGLDWLKSRATPADVTVFYFAGHGELDKGEFYLLPQDVKPADLAKTGVSRKEIKEYVQAIPGKVLVVLDACNSGAIGLLFNDLSRELIDDDCGVAVMCAALPRQYALEAKGKGFFTTDLAGGLGNKDLANQRDGCVYLHQIQSHVITEVMNQSNHRQHPVVVIPPWMRPYPLSKPAAKAP